MADHKIQIFQGWSGKHVVAVDGTGSPYTFTEEPAARAYADRLTRTWQRLGRTVTVVENSDGYDPSRI